MRTSTTGLTLSAALALGIAAHADVWDLGDDTDNAFTTDNFIAPGAEQAHDMSPQLGPLPDEDWYLAPTHSFSSYQFVVDGMTGRLDFTTASVQRLTSNGATVQENALPLELGGALSLNWLGPGGDSNPIPTWVRVRGAACGTACTLNDRYRARFYDTTYTVPRFNNSGTQSTVLLVNNTIDRPCSMTVYFFDASGALRNFTTENLGARELVVVPTANIVPSDSGSILVAHTCGYGGLSGKAVSVEPATGFTFDTALLPRP